MGNRLRKRNAPGKLFFSAARGASSGKKANPAATSCGCGNCSWIATQTPCLCASKPWGPASATKDIEAASFVRSSRMEAQESSPSVLSPRKKFTARRNPDEPAEVGDPQRQSAGRHAGALRSRRLENHAEFTQLRPGDCRPGN